MDRLFILTIPHLYRYPLPELMFLLNSLKYFQFCNFHTMASRDKKPTISSEFIEQLTECNWCSVQPNSPLWTFFVVCGIQSSKQFNCKQLVSFFHWSKRVHMCVNKDTSIVSFLSNETTNTIFISRMLKLMSSLDGSYFQLQHVIHTFNCFLLFTT